MTMIHNVEHNSLWQRIQSLTNWSKSSAAWLHRLGVLGFAALTVSASAVAAGPLTTNTTSFRIPFAVESSNGTAPGGQAILFASRDGGPFEQIQRVPADRRGFQFSAPAEGRYAFAVRVTDAGGQVAGDAEPLTPELEVIVDTTPPVLHLQLAEKAPGEVSVSWTCSEAGVTPGSLRLEYAEGSDGRWMPLNSVAQATGQTTVQSRPGSSVSVRGFISDLAGNQGGGSGQIVLNASATRSQSPNTAETRSASGSVMKGSQAFGASPFPAFGQDSPVAATPSVSQSVNDETNAEPVISFPPKSLPGYRVPAPNGSGFGIPGATQPTPLYINSGSSGGPTLSSAPAIQQQPVHRQSVPSFHATPATHNQSPGNGLTAAGFSSYSVPTPSVHGGQLVNNRVFDIAYEVQDVGPSGVSAVQLFVTENNGQEWFRYGDDADMRSPFPVDTRGEGTFGFEVRVRNGLGFSDPPPQPGDLPSIVVTVDQTPPVAELAQPKVVASGQGHIQLEWRVTDTHPSATPVRLEQAVSTSGPWTPVFDWQTDRRTLDMPILPGMPNAVYFRLLARDEAGNVSVAQTPHPVLIDQQRPTAKLLSIQAASNTRSY
ncbi:MAG: hypothetical protein R3C59_10310 [Planctomycetaceae bacterium]